MSREAGQACPPLQRANAPTSAWARRCAPLLTLRRVRGTHPLRRPAVHHAGALLRAADRRDRALDRRPQPRDLLAGGGIRRHLAGAEAARERGHVARPLGNLARPYRNAERLEFSARRADPRPSLLLALHLPPTVHHHAA